MSSLPVKGDPVLLTCKYSGAGQNGGQEIGYFLHSIAKQNNLAVHVKNVYKSYKVPILKDLCMKVEKGTMYGLIGASGSGKTLALSCILGLLKVDSGDITVFGKSVTNGNESHNFAHKIGYMPQDISLYNEISIQESIEYFGRLYGMRKDIVKKQWLWLVEFLQLPSSFKLIKDCSGGQKRRVSLALALFHNPSLLILDEPTVGLDPLLRESIWCHLYKMVQTESTTIIVTTHFIEESRYSDTIGVMRKGRLLVEDSPEALLKKYQCDLLEQVVLKLCHNDEKVGKQSTSPHIVNNNQMDNVILDNSRIFGDVCDNRRGSKCEENLWKLGNLRRSSIKLGESESRDFSAFQRVKGLCLVLWLMFLRHPSFLIIILFLPTLQAVLTIAVVGTDPKNLKFGVVNHDTMSHETCFMSELHYSLQTEACDFINLSCKLIEEMSKSESLNLIPVKSEEQARDEVVAGNFWGYIKFSSNYSLHLADLATTKKFADNDTLEGSRVHITMDMSNYLAALLVTRNLYEAYENFVSSLANSCGFDSRELKIPMKYSNNVFGNKESTFADYVIPIVVFSVICEVPMLVTSVLFISDRKQGTLERGQVAGLRFKEIMMSYLITQTSVIVAQTTICSVVLHFFYSFRVAGNYCLYFTLCILGGLFGEAFGLFLGVIADEEVEAVVAVMLFGITLLLYEGVLGPLQSMSQIARYFAYFLPTTLMIESLRSVIHRGVGILHSFVWPGIIVLVTWTVFFWVLSVLMVIRKQR